MCDKIQRIIALVKRLFFEKFIISKKCYKFLPKRNLLRLAYLLLKPLKILFFQKSVLLKERDFLPIEFSKSVS